MHKRYSPGKFEIFKNLLLLLALQVILCKKLSTITTY